MKNIFPRGNISSSCWYRLSWLLDDKPKTSQGSF